MKLLIIPTFLLLIPFTLSSCAFLNLDPSPRTPEEIAEAKQAARIRQFVQIQAAVETHDLTLGMRMEEVRSAWGEPHDIENAGGFVSGNQRWVYTEGLSRYGTSPTRLVYFESGRVAGWETR